MLVFSLRIVEAVGTAKRRTAANWRAGERPQGNRTSASCYTPRPPSAQASRFKQTPARMVISDSQNIYPYQRGGCHPGANRLARY
jgi:hypothetical protein